MTDKEHRDVYIAAAVGGTVLVLLFMYMHGSNTPIATAGDVVPTADVASAGGTPYNYNVQPYGGGALIQFASRILPSLGGGGCCDNCGPDSGGLYQNPGVAAFTTLIS